MTALWYDTEFLEDGSTIELISIGMVREDGAEYYAINRDMPEARIWEHEWLRKNVVPSLPLTPGPRVPHCWLDVDHPDVKPRRQIADEVMRFVLGVDKPELWAWYAAYDHVALCQLFGRMIHLPSGFPMFTCDLKQEAVRLGNPRVPEQLSGVHNALADARHNRVIAEFLATVEANPDA